MSDVLFASRFTAKMRSGTRPSVPEGAGDAHWSSATAILSLANDAGSAWVEYDLSLITGNTAANGGTGFTSYVAGDLLVGNAGTTLSKFGVSGASTGDVLTYDPAQALKMKWDAPGGSGAAALGTVVLADTLQSLTDNVYTTLTLQTVPGALAADFDQTTPTSLVVIPAGPVTYILKAFAAFSAPGNGYEIAIAISVNGTAVINYSTQSANSAAHADQIETPPVRVTLAATDYISMSVFQHSSVNQTISNAAGYLSGIEILKVS